jgi:hypothetical protein
MNPEKQPQPLVPAELEVQQSGGRSVAREERLKKAIRRHPQRDIPRVESVEPSQAPPRE